MHGRLQVSYPIAFEICMYSSPIPEAAAVFLKSSCRTLHGWAAACSNIILMQGLRQPNSLAALSITARGIKDPSPAMRRMPSRATDRAWPRSARACPGSGSARTVRCEGAGAQVNIAGRAAAISPGSADTLAAFASYQLPEAAGIAAEAGFELSITVNSQGARPTPCIAFCCTGQPVKADFELSITVDSQGARPTPCMRSAAQVSPLRPTSSSPSLQLAGHAPGCHMRSAAQV